MNKCVQHNKKLDILCTSCNVVICYRCLMSNHNQHRILHTDDIKQSLLDIDYSVVYKDKSDKKDNELENNNNNNTSNDNINKENNKNKDNILQDRIEWLWNKSKETVNHIQKLSKMENDISDHFEQYYEMLMKEERKLKKPIIDELDQTKQQLAQIIKEIQSLHNIIQSITPTLKPDEHNSNDSNDKLDDNHTNKNNNNEDIPSDIATINYSLPTLVESIKQSTTFEQFIHNNSNTIFNIQQQNNNEIIEYLNNKNEINKNKKQINNDNIKSKNNHNDNSILEIIRNHFDQHNIDFNQILNMNNYFLILRPTEYQSHFDGIRYFIKKDLYIDFINQSINNKYNSCFIRMDQDNVLSLYKGDFKSGNQLELMENQSKELVELLEQPQNSAPTLIASSNTTIYFFFNKNQFIAYSIIDKTLIKSNYYGFQLNFMNKPVTCFKEPFYIYFYGKGKVSGGNNLILRYNTIQQTVEQLFVDKDSIKRIPLALFSSYLNLYSMYYDASTKEIVLVEFMSNSFEVSFSVAIIKNIVPTFFSYFYEGADLVYLYYGDVDSDYFIKFNISNSKINIIKLATIEGRAKVDSRNNKLLLLTPMASNYEIKENKKINIFTKDQNYVFSVKDKSWQQSHLQSSNIQHIAKYNK
ncbi:hypothetical protein PPL_08370 [Heterostelium album PN500]|uniref:B box-type domain-containing protein n=1 Tax=Heterostelium pallidum (strain ATCC 26659 / Pp 5 / PN500) TaxID=670386 RepID=D3BI02_HETP5|nr:hypothetical protein PPL_08370 [Heterostelium album PN500]EFA78902.1 hypothetical protein PPL_08370 [Heterostelium album PN500]|eukprot:XP_020431026.1 hypothetical protein PPL_08370 [Heterostelium album PN500]